MADNVNGVLIDDAVEKVQSTIGRSITTKLVPFLTLALVPVTAWLQAQIGIDLSPTELAIYIGTAILGISGVAGAYVKSRLDGVYKLHNTLIDRGIDVYKDGEKAYNDYSNVPLPPGV